MKTPEERLWDWLIKTFPYLEDNGLYNSAQSKHNRKIYDYVTRYWQPKKKSLKTRK